MNKSIWMINKINLKNIKIPFVITGVLSLIILVQDVIKMLIAYGSGKLDELIISVGNYFWLLVPLAAIFIVTKNFRRIINLGGKRNNFLIGSLITYIILSGMASLANTLVYYTYDHFIHNTGYFEGNVNLLELFGWSAHGLVIAFIQQFVFLLFVAAVTHTLVAMQDKWYGWVTDLIIAAIISVFIPIAPLRSELMRFLNLIIFNSNAFLQIIACLILAALIYAISLPVLNRKRI